jgi:cytosine/adenosine deaminase-related metal-dependent hydrolase
MPGLVNAHTHLELTALKDQVPAGKHFTSWILNLIAARKGMTPEEIEGGVGNGVTQSLDAGTTCVGEISTTPRSVSELSQRGIRGIVFLEALGRNGPEAHVWVDELREKIKKLQLQAGPLVSVAVSPHTPYTLSCERLRQLSEYVKNESFPYAIHIAESPMETEYFLHHRGEIKSRFFPAVGWENTPDPPERCTPLAHIQRMGLLTDRLVIVHGVHLTDADLDSVRTAGARVVTCPRSNDYLRVGRPPLEALRQRKIHIGLGTDSLASNASLSLWDEMRFIYRRFSGTDRIPAEILLRMATLGGAKALHLDGSIGSIEPGKEADLIAVHVRGHRSKDLMVSLIQETSPHDIRMVMVAGRTLIDRMNLT